MLKLIPLGFRGAMLRLIKRLRVALEPMLLPSFDIIAERDIAEAYRLLAIDSLMYGNQIKFVSMISTI